MRQWDCPCGHVAPSPLPPPQPNNIARTMAPRGVHWAKARAPHSTSVGHSLLFRVVWFCSVGPTSWTSVACGPACAARLRCRDNRSHAPLCSTPWMRWRSWWHAWGGAPAARRLVGSRALRPLVKTGGCRHSAAVSPPTSPSLWEHAARSHPNGRACAGKAHSVARPRFWRRRTARVTHWSFTTAGARVRAWVRTGAGVV